MFDHKRNILFNVALWLFKRCKDFIAYGNTCIIISNIILLEIKLQGFVIIYFLW